MNIDIIGHIHTCYGGKFGVPRQPGIVAEAWGELIFEPPFRNKDTLRGLEGFSHIWLIFTFHKNTSDDWKPLVRPPRLGGNEKVGVFASRSPFRPNPIGMSCVTLDAIDLDHPDGPVLRLSGIDLVDGTPIIDIKPYIPYSDSLPDADGGFASQTPDRLIVAWSEQIDQKQLADTLRCLIEETLSADPRPAYQQNDPTREYGCFIENYNVRWIVDKQRVTILSCKKLSE